MGCASSKGVALGAPPKHGAAEGGGGGGGGGGGDAALSAAASGSIDGAAGDARASSGGKAADTLVASALRSKRARGAVILGDSHITDEEREAASRRRGAKPPDVRAMLRRALLSNVLFGAYGSAELSALVDALERCACAAGDVVIQQGAVGDAFYVIESGRVRVCVCGEVAPRGAGMAGMGLHSARGAHSGAAAPPPLLPACIHALAPQPAANTPRHDAPRARPPVRVQFEIIKDGVKVADWGDGTANWTFGELALMYNCPRAATVRCGGGGGGGGAVLWRVDRRTFRGVVAHAAREQHAKLKRALRRGLLEGLTEAQLDRVADAATVVRYGAGEQIIRKGEAGEVFFIIDEGAVLCRNLGGGQADNLLQAGDYFGERALLTCEPRAADVFAEGPAGCTLVALHRDDFTALLGHLRELLEHNVGMRLLLCMPTLAALSDDDRTALFGSLRVASFASGQAILAAGSVPTELFIVKEGCVRVVPAAAGAAVAGGGSSDGAGECESNLLLAPPPAGGGSPGHQRAQQQQPPPLQLLQPGHFFPPRELAALEPVACSYFAEAAQPSRGASTDGDNDDPSSAARQLPPPPPSTAAAAVQCFVTDRATYMRLVAPYIAAQEPAPAARSRRRGSSSSSSSKGGATSSASSRPASAASPSSEPPARLAQLQPQPSQRQARASHASSGGSAHVDDDAPVPPRALSSLSRAAADDADTGGGHGTRGGGEQQQQQQQQHDPRHYRHQPDFRLSRSEQTPDSGGGSCEQRQQRQQQQQQQQQPLQRPSPLQQPQQQPQPQPQQPLPQRPQPQQQQQQQPSVGEGGVSPSLASSSSFLSAAAASRASAFSATTAAAPAAPAAPTAAPGGGVPLPPRGERPARRRLGLPFRELEQRATVGTGTFGRVRLVLHRASNRAFALKMLQKAQVVALKQQANILNERALLWRVDHPFVIKLFDTYRDRDRLYMLLELVQGGELFSRLQAEASGRISVAEARFYAACVLDALDYIHSLDILYR